MSDTADLDQLWGFPLRELVLMKCPCCHTDLEDHSMTEAFRCAQATAQPKRRGAKPNPEGCQSRLYGRWGVHAKCWLAHEDGSDPDRHSNGYRKWTTAESIATEIRHRGG